MINVMCKNFNGKWRVQIQGTGTAAPGAEKELCPPEKGW